MPHLLACDTECTGVDPRHGSRPYIVTTYDQDTKLNTFWQWDVDPVTRVPQVPQDDKTAIQALLNSADLIYFQVSKFDGHMLRTIDVEIPWSKVRDTIMSGHLLASNHPHGLEKMCAEYLGYDIEHFEAAVQKATVLTRKIVKRDYPTWRLAKEGDRSMPSIDQSSKRDEDKEWKADMWLLRALIKQTVADLIGVPTEDFTLADIEESDPDIVHAACDYKEYPYEWLTLTKDYGNADSATTLPLGLRMEQLIRERGLWKIYEERMKLPQIAFEMEERGVTASEVNTLGVIEQYGMEAAEAEDQCVSIAKKYGHDLELPAGATVNDSLREFFYGSTWLECPRCGKETKVKEWSDVLKDDNQLCPKCEKKGKGHALVHTKVHRRRNLGLEKVYSEKTGNPTLDKDAMAYYLATLEGEPWDFVDALMTKRSRAVAVGYAESYVWFWLPTKDPLWRRMHPTYNPVGTDHLRWSSYNYNMQNVSDQEDSPLRGCFGPAPGREWWSMDFKNLELRIPAYESGEPAMIELFERSSDPPYFGSYHLLNASIIYPDEFWPLAEREGEFKHQHKNKYKRIKGFGFAKQYGCGRRKADKVTGVAGSFDMLDAKLPLVAKLTDYIINFARKNGYVETIPDRDIDPDRGYPILASRDERGNVGTTTPFNYHTSGTAMQCTNKAMVQCEEKALRPWRAEGFDAFITAQVHDQLVFDMPAGEGMSNIPRATRLRELMEDSGRAISIPTPVSVEFIPHGKSWAEGVAV